MSLLRRLRARVSSDGGYAVILTALVLVPLMGFAGFAVDVGAWYSRASELQRAADAAALAGVVWQPDFATAETKAREEAAKNGFTHGVGGIEVNVTDTGDNQLQVQIVDTDVDMYFSGLFLDEVAIGRQATAEYVDSVPLGSPENRFGTGPDTFGGTFPATDYYAAINGYCVGKEQGDWLTAGWVGIGYGACNPPSAGWTVNDDHDPVGYWFAIEKPEGLATDIQVQVKHGSGCQSSSPDVNLTGATGFDTVYTLHEADNTPLNDFDNPVYATYTATKGADCSANWQTYFTIPGGATSGRWYLNVQQPPAGFASGLNAFGLYASVGGSTTPCSSLVTATCPAIYAIGHMGVWVPSSGASATFYLAEIGDEHAGKRMRVGMWDPAEGMSNLRLRDPLGNAVAFDWESTDELNPAHNTTGTTTTCSGEPCLDVVANDFNGALVEIYIDLPTSATFATYPNNWWTVSYYASGGSVRDRTTWTVEILGDPVRLLE